MKLGRNDPCSCGSGKKYKKCCLASKADVGDLLWRQLRSIDSEMASILMGHAKKRFGPQAFKDAWDEFWFWEERNAPENGVETQLIGSFFLYNWIPDIDSDTYEIAPKDTTIGLDFFEQKGKSLSSLERNFLSQNLEEPFSFYEIIQVDQGEGYRLKDIFLGAERDVIEKSGSRAAQIGDILFAKVIQIEHVAMVCGCGWILIPPIHKKAVIDLRKKLQKSPHAEKGVITVSTLQDFDIELRELFLSIHDTLMTPPRLHNTDGDPISLHRITYDIDSAEMAFEALASLSLMQNRDELLEDAERDAEGGLRKIEIPWQKQGNKLHKEWDNTVMGRLEIEGRKLTVEVNSQKRAKLIKKEIETRLQERARHKSTTLQSPESLMRQLPKQRDEEAEREREEKQRELMNHPEIQTRLRESAKQHWDNWFGQKIPALGNKTPLQAAKNAEGRELLEALLKHYSRSESSMDAIYQPDWGDVRKRLGIETTSDHG